MTIYFSGHSDIQHTEFLDHYLDLLKLSIKEDHLILVNNDRLGELIIGYCNSIKYKKIIVYSHNKKYRHKTRSYESIEDRDFFSILSSDALVQWMRFPERRLIKNIERKRQLNLNYG